MTRRLQQLRHHLRKGANTSFASRFFALLLSLSLFIGSAVPVFAQTPAPDPRQALTEEVKVSTSLPFGLGQVELESDETMRRAAWSLYVELTTRIVTQTLETDQGFLREALNSLYNLFASTRQILREAGPDVGTSLESVGGIAITVLNVGLRPFLSRWHPALSAWESQRPANMGAKEHEKNWAEEPQLRSELKLLRENLEQYADALAEIVGLKK